MWNICHFALEKNCIAVSVKGVYNKHYRYDFKISRVFTVYRRAEQARVQEGVYDTSDLSLWKLYLKFVPDLINFISIII